MSSECRVDNGWVLWYTGGIKGVEIMKKLLIGVLIGLLSLSVVGGDFTLFVQPNDRVPYFGVRGLHELIYDRIEISAEWEISSFVFLEPRPFRDLDFYIFQIMPKLQFELPSRFSIGVSVFAQYRTNNPRHYVLQPEFFIEHEW